ncbi:MAG: sensor histidine kinase, partial [Owenweeksia sp.]
VSRENEKIIREQNVVLEQRVLERTMELQEANEELQVTLANLKDTQTQLVDAEKMASLGQLTAGIAHEINNPINFVTSNIAPLRRDLEEIYEIVDTYASVPLDNAREALEKAHALQEDYDYEYLKEEIESLVDGISDGATRTSEIVKGLRTFSRLDEDAVKQISLQEGLNSTLVLLRNKTKDLIEVETDFDQSIPDIECYPGKLNQVFMNVLTNGIYAVNAKRYEEGEKPTLTLKTMKAEGNRVSIHLIDNGIGMDETTKKKMFEPFFTTKDVGEGTGLGMSIVFKIIEKHNGSIAVNSEPGKGTEFIITLPMSQPNAS